MQIITIGPIEIAIATAFSAAIGALWKQVMNNHAQTKKDMEECREGHKDRDETLLELVGEVSTLKGKQEGLMLGVELAVKGVQEEVRDALKNKKE